MRATTAGDWTVSCVDGAAILLLFLEFTWEYARKTRMETAYGRVIIYLKEVKCMEEKRGRGRPKKSNGYVERYNLWLSEKDVDILNEIEYADNITRAEALRKALRTYIRFIKNGD